MNENNRIQKTGKGLSGIRQQQTVPLILKKETQIHIKKVDQSQDLEELIRKRRAHKIGTKYDKTGKATKSDWVLHLLKSQNANMGMICAYAGTSEQTVRQLIVNLRKEGHHISIVGYEDYGDRQYRCKGIPVYQYMGYFP